jgi:hypothetical protein
LTGVAPSEACSTFCGLSMSEQPTDDVVAVNVEDHVEMETGPFGRAFQLVISQDHTRRIARSSGLESG